MYICQVNVLSCSPMPAPTRARSPRGQGGRLREELLRAARELLLELGDQDKLSVRAVTARAGVSPNALYLHFADREDLLSSLITAAYTDLRTFLADAVGDAAGPLERLRAFMLAYLEFASTHPGIYRVLFMTKLREGVPMPERDAPSGADEGVDTFNDLLAVVDAVGAAGSDPFARAAELWASLHGYASLKQVMPAFPWPSERDYVERMIEVHMR